MFMNYSFTELDEHNELVDEISSLESRMAQALGEEVRLIAYSHVNSDDSSNDTMDKLNK